MQIKNIYGDVIFTSQAETLKAAVVEAVKSGAYLSGANLSGAILSGADLSRADLSGANLKDVKNGELALARFQFIPTEGSFIGWKKCANNVIVKLQITENAKRSHGAERKCRASEALVLEVFGGEFGISAGSYGTVEYRVGRIITPLNRFCEDRWTTCAAGIHFFLTREEAEDYEF